MGSILDSIKQMLGIAPDDTNFDSELILHINSAIAVLTQLGIGPNEGFRITGPLEEWDSLIEMRQDIDSVKSVVYYRVRLAFDPPQNSFLVDSIKKQCDELEWRLEVSTSTPPL